LIARGTSVIAVVAQNPGGPSGNLSTLVPLAYLDGEAVYPDDFPNYGLIFWYMSRKEVASPFLPGMIVIASIESASVLDTVPMIDRHQYRVEHDSVRDPDPSDVIEVIDYTTRSIAHPRDLLFADDIVISHRPLPRVFIKTPDAIYGPFSTDYKVVDTSSNDYSISVRPIEDKVALIEPGVFESISDSNFIFEAEATVSLRPSPPHKSGKVVRCSYQLVCSPGIQALREAEKQFLLVRTPEQILKPLTRKYIERNKYQAVQALFDEFVNNLGNEREGLTLGQTEVIESIQTALERDRRLVRELTDGLLASGLLDTTIEERLRTRTEQYITDNTAEIAAKIRERTRELQVEVETLEKNRRALESDLDARSRQVAQHLEAEKAAVLAECAAERTKLEIERVELESKRNELTKYLHDVTTKYTESRDQVINDFLALMPLLERTNVVEGRKNGEGNGSRVDRIREFAMPAFLTSATGEYGPVTEDDFFSRFVSHVEACGFKYREVDLISFHLNFKSSEFFVLGGVSGTGKSSLPRLYADALSGDVSQDSSRFLRIAVNPTWLEVNDVLGRVNVLDRTFNPAETGLFRHLAFAETEYNAKKSESGMWPVVLDEMNLAQAEHYFGPFLQVFGLDETRTVSVFDPTVLDVKDPFVQWAKLTLPKTIRFIGTVNFDETTKQLSLRLLDRGPLARIDIAPSSTTKPAKKASGAPILLRHFQDWQTHTEISRAGSKLLDEMNPSLRQLGCPFNPRRRNAIDAFLTNSNPSICSPDQAFDLAISQRVLSLVRGLFRQSARDAFDQLERAILDSNLELPECERVLGEIREREYNLLLTT
jgi:hypothetical protein